MRIRAIAPFVAALCTAEAHLAANTVTSDVKKHLNFHAPDPAEGKVTDFKERFKRFPRLSPKLRSTKFTASNETVPQSSPQTNTSPIVLRKRIATLDKDSENSSMFPSKAALDASFLTDISTENDDQTAPPAPESSATAKTEKADKNRAADAEDSDDSDAEDAEELADEKQSETDVSEDNDENEAAEEEGGSKLQPQSA